MKKIIAVIILSGLLFSADASFAGSDAEYIKVGLAFGSRAVSSAVLKCVDGFVLTDISYGAPERIQHFPYSVQLTFDARSGRIAVRDGDGTVIVENLGADMCLLPDGGLLTYDDKPFRGGICLKMNANGRMDVINYITLEEYLYGVLNSEMGYQNPLEALKAQAVTARSFALGNMEKHNSDGFNLCTDVHCQVYKGYSDEHSATNAAVDETSGMVMTYGGKTVAGYYFKNSGGHTLSADDVWGGKSPYLIGVKDEYSPEYLWNHSLSFKEIRAGLEAAGHSIGNVRGASITGRNAAGAVSTVEFRGTSGTVVLKNENIRAVFGGTNVRSLTFSFGTGTAGENEVIHVLGAGGTVQKMKPQDVFVISGDGLSKLVDYGYTASERFESVADEPVVFCGSGYGHGVGMPQDSAIAMAKLGFSFEEILKYFYTGIEIQ